MISDGNHTMEQECETGSVSKAPAHSGHSIRERKPERSAAKQQASKHQETKRTAKQSARSSDDETLHVPHASRLYHNLVPAYQAFWPAIARKRIAQGISSLGIQPNANVLEVGVGTGMSLQSYPKNIDITGVDLSESMLAEATQLIQDKHWDRINVLPMNAEKLEFDDSTFDVVTSFHTITVVSDPRKMMGEVVRVCKPGGQILIINHFRSDNPLIARVVDSAGNITKRLGWRTDLELSEVVREFPLVLDDRYKPNPLSLFTIMKATCTKSA
ncbi:class I SAM-dependent methyltransferase [Stieleria marina]|uniref:Demethylmenaquinone methyltransferase n=1 Tax=Stieleria marina TaxID=1930275 RepID=A0A517NRE6_9BACT|nr:Demethylmenaquinone methyltransferase [Planctomycetes bacterium K23_9]